MTRCCLVAIALGALVFVGCSESAPEPAPKPVAATKPTPEAQPEPKAPAPKAVTAKDSSQRSNAKVFLARLKVAPEVTSGYDRELFNHWTTQQSGCDTRDVVLARQDRSSGPCGAASGSWYSTYDGEQFTDPGDLDVDHMVPLSEAWDSGANSWPAAKREAYANDLHPYSLLAVSASSNREKSDQDPAQWLPSNEAFLCQYTARWIAVKFRWRLTIDSAEKSVLTELVNSCSAQALKLDTSWETKGGGKAPAPAAASKKPKAQSGKKSGGRDPLFSSCTAAKAAGYGPYVRGKDREYSNYTDGDGDGTVCE